MHSSSSSRAGIVAVAVDVVGSVFNGRGRTGNVGEIEAKGQGWMTDVTDSKTLSRTAPAPVGELRLADSAKKPRLSRVAQSAQLQ